MESLSVTLISLLGMAIIGLIAYVFTGAMATIRKHENELAELRPLIKNIEVQFPKMKREINTLGQGVNVIEAVLETNNMPIPRTTEGDKAKASSIKHGRVK